MPIQTRGRLQRVVPCPVHRFHRDSDRPRLESIGPSGDGVRGPPRHPRVPRQEFQRPSQGFQPDVVEVRVELGVQRFQGPSQGPLSKMCEPLQNDPIVREVRP